MDMRTMERRSIEQRSSDLQTKDLRRIDKRLWARLGAVVCVVLMCTSITWAPRAYGGSHAYGDTHDGGHGQPTMLPAVPTLTAPHAAGAVKAASAVHTLTAPYAASAETGHASRFYVLPVDGEVAFRFDPPAEKWLAGHRGVDIWTTVGGAVAAPFGGVVSFVGSVGGKPVVVINHPDGLRSSLEPVVGIVAVGETVAQGQPVGHLGVSSSASNPNHCRPDAGEDGEAACVHWGVRRGDIYLDPLSLLGPPVPIVLLPWA
ncbi:MAG: M23 family metallopeptidase [Cellulomonadaceae bacterium]|nr:M23 family metallopeptidase [Cellulomonadaceae bacterium]